MNREQFHAWAAGGLRILDGAMGSNLRAMGMKNDDCSELWAEAHPDLVEDLLRRYVDAGSELIYAPTFLAQPKALQAFGRETDTEALNCSLAKLARRAADGRALVAGDLASMAATVESWDEENFEDMVEDYRRQIRGLVDGGVDLLVAETLLYPTEAEAVFAAAELEKAPAVLYSFTMQPDGSLFSGRDALPILKNLEDMGAAAVGLNCVPASHLLPATVARFRRVIRGPLSVKPNAGDPVIGPDKLAHYPMGPEEFASIARECLDLGANLLGGCCGTNPDFIRELVRVLKTPYPPNPTKP